VVKRSLIFKKYISTWFLIDLISNIPLDWILKSSSNIKYIFIRMYLISIDQDSSGVSGGYLRILRIARVLRLLRALKLK
jgi:hypothetical protein